MKITTKWNTFKTVIKNFIEEADDLLYFERENLRPDECKLLEKKTVKWAKSVEKYLQNSFDTSQNDFYLGFCAAKAYNSFMKINNANILEKLNRALDELNTKKKTLQYFIELLSISDAIIQPRLIDLETRALYTQNEIKDLILDKLYHLYNHNYYPVHEIIKGNGIKTSKNVVNEILESLETKGYIRIINSRKVLVQLSLRGKVAIENKRNFEPEISDKVIMETQKVEITPKSNGRILKTETIYHYFDRQLAS